jgi:hypothetical protein
MADNFVFAKDFRQVKSAPGLNLRARSKGSVRLLVSAIVAALANLAHLPVVF